LVAPPPSAAARVTRHRRAPYARPIACGGADRIGATPRIPPKKPDDRRRGAAVAAVAAADLDDALDDATVPSAPTRARGASADHDARVPTAPGVSAARGVERHARVVLHPAGATRDRARGVVAAAAAVAMACLCVAGAPAKAATVARAIRAAFETDLPLMRGRSRAFGARRAPRETPGRPNPPCGVRDVSILWL
jgi:hypothetical protein